MIGSIKKIELSTVLNELKDLFLPKYDERALVVNISNSISCIVNDIELVENCILEIMFYNPNNFCKVAYRINNKEFILVADHDSCWREGVNRCLDETLNHLDNRFEEVCKNELGSDYVHILKNVDLYLENDLALISPFKFIDNPSIIKKDDNYNSVLETNF